MQTCYFRYFRHAWSRQPKIITSTWRKLWCLSSCKQFTWSIQLTWSIFSWDILYRIPYSNSQRVFWALTWEHEFRQIRGLWPNMNKNDFLFSNIWGKTNDKTFLKNTTPFLAHFAHFWARKFLKILFSPVFLTLWLSIIMSKLKNKKLMSRFQAKLVSGEFTDVEAWIYRTLLAKPRVQISNNLISGVERCAEGFSDTNT